MTNPDFSCVETRFVSGSRHCAMVLQNVKDHSPSSLLACQQVITTKRWATQMDTG